jgi:biopolymer transport protein ExbD
MNFIRRKSEIPKIDIAPLVDIIFLLLIFFMLSSNFIKPMLKMELPQASHEEEKLEKIDLIVTVDEAQNIFINKESISLQDLKGALQKSMVELGKNDVIFSGDKNIGYDLFVTILDIAKEAGATSFSVEHSKGE